MMNTPTTEVHRFNLHLLLPTVLALLRAARFVALDTEFTGLGDPGKLRAKDLEERFDHMRRLAESHALVAFGLSAFVDVPGADGEPPRLCAHTFNFTLLRDSDFSVTPQSLMFLVDTGFDFNYQMRMGIPYLPRSGVPASAPGSGQQQQQQQQQPSRRATPAPAPPPPSKLDSLALAQVFEAVMGSGRPVVVHNGLLDLVFLYRSFYGPLPETLETFAADLCELCTGGLYDTKYVADFHTHEPASFLAFLFRKYERQSAGRLTVDVAPEIVIPTELFALPPLTPKELAVCGNEAYCVAYARHGFCRLGRRCRKSHNLDLILDNAEIIFGDSKERKRKRRKLNRAAGAAKDDEEDRDNDDDGEGEAAAAAETGPSGSAVQLFVSKPDAYHAAGYDAHMTAFIFAWQQVSVAADVLQASRNKLYLISKDFPLLVWRGPMTRTSALHRHRVQGRAAAAAAAS